MTTRVVDQKQQVATFRQDNVEVANRSPTASKRMSGERANQIIKDTLASGPNLTDVKTLVTSQSGPVRDVLKKAYDEYLSQSVGQRISALSLEQAQLFFVQPQDHLAERTELGSRHLELDHHLLTTDDQRWRLREAAAVLGNLTDQIVEGASRQIKNLQTSLPYSPSPYEQRLMVSGSREMQGIFKQYEKAFSAYKAVVNEIWQTNTRGANS